MSTDDIRRCPFGYFVPASSGHLDGDGALRGGHDA